MVLSGSRLSAQPRRSPPRGGSRTRARSAARSWGGRRARRSSSEFPPATSPTRSSASPDAESATAPMNRQSRSDVGGRAPRGHPPDDAPRRHPPEDWADELANRVRDAGPQVVNDSKTPSGTVHVGSLRGPVILDAITRALRANGVETTLLYGVDDLDPMDAQALLTPDAIGREMGRPLAHVPD